MKHFLIILCCLFTFVLKAQSSYQIGSISRLNLNTSLKKDWQFNFNGETRSLYFNQLTKTKAKFKYENQFNDVAVLGSKKIGLSNLISAGFQLRFGDKIEKRFTQQFNIIKTYYNYNLAHRFTTDQTVISNESITHRLRYRLGFSKSLSGDYLNIKEFYFKFNNEYLNIFQSKDYDLEVRITPAIGFNFTDKNKVELAAEYRINGFINADVNHGFFAVFKYYISI